MTLLSVRHLTTELQVEGKTFPVVRDLSFDLHAGQTLALVGESGSGKSMTAFSLLNLLPHPPALRPKGEVIFQGENLLTFSEKQMRQVRGGKIAIVFQDPRRAFNPVYTIGKQILEVVETHLGLRGKEALEVVYASLKEVSLPDPERRMKEYPHQMSGGMLQRAAIAMAIAPRPSILIADEPTTALDVTIQKEILATLKEIQNKTGMGLLLITHDMGVVAEMADQVIVLYASEKMEEGSVYDIFDNPSHPYTEALFSLRNLKRGPGGRLPTIKGSIPSLDSLPQGCLFSPRCPSAFKLCEQCIPQAFALKEQHNVKCHLFDPDLKEKLHCETYDS